MRINTNMNAMVATNQMSKNTALAGNAMEKLSTGLRITKAGDDAAGLAISEKMRSQIRGMEQANRNVQDGISLIQTAEGALEEAGNIAQRMRELGVQAGNSTLSSEDREKIAVELNQLADEIGSIADETKFNGTNILTTPTVTRAAGDAPKFSIQAGANGEVREIETVDLKEILNGIKDTTPTTPEGGGEEGGAGTYAAGGITVSTDAEAKALVTKLDTALEAINTGRSNLGATQNRLEYTSSNLVTSTENLSAAESRIRDVDVAKEMVNLSKLNILNQASQSMVTQAKQQPESVMQLLR